MESIETKRDADLKDTKSKDLIVVLDETFYQQTIEFLAGNIYAFGAKKLFLVDWRDAVTTHLGISLTHLPLKPAIKRTFIERFMSAEECLGYLKQKNYTIIAISSHLDDNKTNVMFHEVDFTKKKLAVWFGRSSKSVNNRCDDCVSVDVRGNVDYLNYDALITIVLNEIAKKRDEYNQKTQ